MGSPLELRKNVWDMVVFLLVAQVVSELRFSARVMFSCVL